MSVDLRWLRALVAVVDSGTFTDAAIDLGVSQATVSRAVASLEADLGVRLLRRTTRVVSPTSAGARVAVHARRVLGELENLQRAATESDGVLRVGYAWSALGRHTTTVLHRWSAAHPGTRLDLVQSNTPSSGLIEQVADLAVIRVRAAIDPRFETALIGVEGRYAAVSVDDPWARRRFVRMADFIGRTVATDATTSTTHGGLWGSDPRVTLRSVHGMDEWLNLIGAGAAVGMSAQATADQHPRPGVVYRPVRDAEPIQVRLAWWRDDPPPQTQAFLAVAREAYAS